MIIEFQRGVGESSDASQNASELQPISPSLASELLSLLVLDSFSFFLRVLRRLCREHKWGEVGLLNFAFRHG